MQTIDDDFREAFVDRLFTEAVLHVLARQQAPSVMVPALALAALRGRLPSSKEWLDFGRPHGPQDAPAGQHKSVTYLMNIERRYSPNYLTRVVLLYFDAHGLQSDAVEQFEAQHGPGSIERLT